MKNIKRKGFTLVELLIVIVVIGVLSAMMMISSTQAVSSARAAAIVSNLHNLKTAALSYYADNNSTTDNIENILKYMDGGEVATSTTSSTSVHTAYTNYQLEGGSNSPWVVSYNASDETKDVRDKITSKATTSNVDLKSAASCKSAYAGSGTVYVMILNFGND